MDITNSYDYLDYEDKFRIILLNKIKLDYSKFNFTDRFNKDIINGEPKITCNNLIINNYLKEETEENNIFYYEKEKEILINSKNLVKRKDDNDNFIFNKYETYSYNNYFYKNCFINTDILKKKYEELNDDDKKIILNLVSTIRNTGVGDDAPLSFSIKAYYKNLNFKKLNVSIIDTVDNYKEEEILLDRYESFGYGEKDRIFKIRFLYRLLYFMYNFILDLIDKKEKFKFESDVEFLFRKFIYVIFNYFNFEYKYSFNLSEELNKENLKFAKYFYKVMTNKKIMKYFKSSKQNYNVLDKCLDYIITILEFSDSNSNILINSYRINNYDSFYFTEKDVIYKKQIREEFFNLFKSYYNDLPIKERNVYFIKIKGMNFYIYTLLSIISNHQSPNFYLYKYPELIENLTKFFKYFLNKYVDDEEIEIIKNFNDIKKNFIQKGDYYLERFFFYYLSITCYVDSFDRGNRQNLGRLSRVEYKSFYVNFCYLLNSLSNFCNKYQFITQTDNIMEEIPKEIFIMLDKTIYRIVNFYNFSNIQAKEGTDYLRIYNEEIYDYVKEKFLYYLNKRNHLSLTKDLNQFNCIITTDKNGNTNVIKNMIKDSNLDSYPNISKAIMQNHLR